MFLLVVDHLACSWPLPTMAPSIPTREQPMMYLTLLEEVFPIAAPAREMSAIWAGFPESLMESVLLLLPAVSQARFCTVCKPWRKLIMSSRFQDQTAAIALRSGKAIALCRAMKAFDTVERFKVAKMVLPADVDEKDLIPSEDWCAQGGLLALMVHCYSSTGNIRIFVFNPVEETPCQELPPLPWGHVGDLSIVVDGDNSFRVVLSFHTEDLVEEGFYICSSSANGIPPMTWSRIVISQSSAHQLILDIGADVDRRLRLTSDFLSRQFIYAFVWYWKGNCTSYAPVRLSAQAEYVSRVPPLHQATAVHYVHYLPSYHSEALFAVLLDCTIFKLDEGSTVWTLVSSSPQVLGSSLKVLVAEIVGDTLLMVVVTALSRVDVIAYHTVCNLWTRVCQTYYRKDYRGGPNAYLASDRLPTFIAPRSACVHGMPQS